MKIRANTYRILILASIPNICPAAATDLTNTIPIQTYHIGWSISDCDKVAASKALKKMSPLQILREEKNGDWVIVTYGHQYYKWTPFLKKLATTTYMDASTCLTGLPQQFEFRKPNGALVSRIIVKIDAPKKD